MSKHVEEKSGKLYFLYSMLKKMHNSFINWRKVTTLEYDRRYIITKLMQSDNTRVWSVVHQKKAISGVEINISNLLAHRTSVI